MFRTYGIGEVVFICLSRGGSIFLVWGAKNLSSNCMLMSISGQLKIFLSQISLYQILGDSVENQSYNGNMRR